MNGKYRKYRPYVVALCVCLIWLIYIFFDNFNWQVYMSELTRNTIRDEMLPVVSYLENGNDDKNIMEKFISGLVPFYNYVLADSEDVITVNVNSALDSNGSTGNLSDSSINGVDNLAQNTDMPNEEVTKQEETTAAINTDISSAISKGVASGTVYNRTDLNNFDFVRSHFYTVTSITSLNDNMLRSEEFLNKNLTVSHDNTTPQILIFHTHSQETFVDSVEGNVETTIVGIGNYLTKLLNEKYGYNVIHDTSVYDLVDGTLDRSKAYTYAEEGIDRILNENPSIDVVIDLHRDGVADTTHLVTTHDGKQMSRIMFFNGLSYSNVNGDIDYLINPNRDDNLAMSLQMQLLGEAYYPGFLRNIYINAYRYCLHKRGKSMLIEAGAQTNTVQEELNAMEPLADILDKLLRGEKAY